MSLFTLDFARDVQIARQTFSSENHPITVETYLPKTAGRYPCVLALHGSGGIREGWSEQPAGLLSSRGFAVFVPHYFERTGTGWADDTNIRRNFPAWMQTARDAISFATAQPNVRGPVGLIGFSLGAYLALSVATQDARVKAVVDYFGGLPEELHGEAHKIPPVLILHGDADRVVPVTEAERLASVLKKNGSPYEMKVFRGAGHGFGGFDLLSAGQMTLGFLERNLK